MSLLTSFDTSVNFWEAFPQMKIPKPFAELYKKDKSKGHADSSQIMWAVAMLVDTSEENKFRNFSEEEKKLLLSEDFLENSKFDWSKYTIIIDTFSEFTMSKLEKSLLTYERKLEERDSFIKNLKYDLDNLDKIDKAMKSTSEIFDLISKLRDAINKEKNSGTTKSGMVESALENNMFS